MKHLTILLVLLPLLCIPTKALDIEAPTVPSAGAEYMPEDTTSLGDALREILEKVLSQLHSVSAAALRNGASLLMLAVLLSLFSLWDGGRKIPGKAVGAIMGSTLLLGNSKTMIQLAANTIQELTDYGKLLFPVLTTAMAAQGGMTTSTALYTGTMVLDILLSQLISGLLLPSLYIFLAVSVAYAVTGEAFLKRIRDFIKSSVSWCLKVLLTGFTAYMNITGVVSGTTDVAALKATKVTISSVVPVVGGVLSDASEAVLVSAGVLRNAAGIYGILAMAAVFLAPFLKIGLHYLVLKGTASLCALFETGGLRDLVEDVSTAMGLLLAMTGSVCLLLLVSTVCFLKEVG